ncbi:MAG TPA: DUF2752 domain-containing protein [Iamia sp.]|nr:DUF2752 domain-containing protein [Iamia sp.]
MTATTGSEPDTGWHVPPPEPNAFERLRQRKPWAPPAILGGVLALGTAYTAWQDPNRGSSLFPGCPLKEATGLDCPGCGGTRALHALTQGDIGTALDHNAVLTVVLPLLAVAWGLWLLHTIRVTRARTGHADPPAWPAPLRALRLSHRGWLAVIGFMVAFAVVRNISAVPALDFLASEA